MKYNKGELIIPMLMAAFMAAYCYQVRVIPFDVLIWPACVAIVVVTLMIVVICTYVFDTPKSEHRRASFHKPFMLILITVIFLAGMKLIGFSLGSFFYLLAIQLYLGAEKKRAFAVSIAVVLFLHVVMIMGLGLAVPRLVTPYFTL